MTTTQNNDNNNNNNNNNNNSNNKILKNILFNNLYKQDDLNRKNEIKFK